MHSWLPDAHSQAPAPVSALMSGVLLDRRVLRAAALQGDRGRRARHRLQPNTASSSSGSDRSSSPRHCCITQRDYKRMLAYHSIEHMGLIALGAAAGSSLAIAAVLLHILGHGLAKAVLFLASGEILIVEGSSEIEKVPALLVATPRARRHLRFRPRRAVGPPTVQSLRERAEHDPRRVRRRAWLGSGHLARVHGGDLRGRDVPWPTPPARTDVELRCDSADVTARLACHSSPDSSRARPSASSLGRSSHYSTPPRRSSCHDRRDGTNDFGGPMTSSAPRVELADQWRRARREDRGAVGRGFPPRHRSSRTTTTRRFASCTCFVAGPPDRRVELQLTTRPDTTVGAITRRALVPCEPLRTGDARPVRNRSNRSSVPPSPCPSSTLASGLASDAPRCRAAATDADRRGALPVRAGRRPGRL